MKRNALSFFLRMIKPFSLMISVQLFIMMIWAFDASFRPYLVKIMLDTITQATPDNVGQLLFYPVTAYLAMTLCITLIFRLYDYIWLYVNPGIKRHVGEHVVGKMLKHSQRFYQSNFSGAITNKVKDLSNGVPDLLCLVLEQFIPTLFAVIIALIFLGSVHLYFAVGLSCWVFLYVMGSVFLTKPAALLSRNAAEARSELTGYYVDLFNNIMSVRLFSGYKNEEKLTRKKFDLYVSAERAKDKFFQKLFFFQGATFFIYQAISIYLLVKGIQKGILTPGDFTLILSINLEIIHILWTFSRDIGDYATIIGTLQQGLEALYHPHDVVDKAHAELLSINKGGIVYDNVCFGHRAQGYFFKNLKVKIKPGEKIGLVGFSGGGKTTFVNLLLRLYDIAEGSIKIDGQNIQDITQDSLRHAIGFIPQEPGLFQRSILENIRYGKRDASLEEVQHAAMKARAHDFIMKLPQQYDTEIGERGLRLSGGQRQRIAIARAILKNAPILILDEATSQLDSLTEQDIQASLNDLMNDKTTLVIAHRLSTLQKMDRILVFDNGVIVQDGTHHQLASQVGLYQQLWNAQMEGLLQIEAEDESQPE
ncbi:ABC transporter ATP-binding protein [bacterium]|nr:ABC transporter ATP-binding protein [bacterium]NBX71837.1 ABC transporter ATP-binding protein [bacterium]